MVNKVNNNMANVSFSFTNQSSINISNAFTCLMSKDNSFDTNTINVEDSTPFFSIQIKGYGVITMCAKTWPWKMYI